MDQDRKSNKRTFALGSLAMIFVLFGSSAIWLNFSRQLENKNDEIASLQAKAQTLENDLAAAKAEAAGLDNPMKKANDTKRKRDLARFITEVNNYAANNSGNFPSSLDTEFAEKFESKYVTGVLKDFSDPNTMKTYEIIPVPLVHTPPGVTLGTIQYQWPGKCAGSEFDDDATERQAAARLILESGDIYCLDS